MDTWKQGFATREAAFTWAASSRFFSAERLEDAQNRSKRKEKAKREMYNSFKLWALEQPREKQTPTWTPEIVVAEALVYFNKKAKYDEVMEEYTRIESIHQVRRRVKSMFSGPLVAEWTGLGNLDVKRVMDMVRERKGGEATMDGLTMEEIRNAVEQAAVELNFRATDYADATDKMGKMDLAT